MYDTCNPYGDDTEGWIETIVDYVSELGSRTNIRASRIESKTHQMADRWPADVTYGGASDD